MATFHGVVRSGLMEMDTGLSVILPYDKPGVDKSPKKVLYLLHGLKQSASSWLRGSMVERYAMEADMVVIMPEVQRSFYCDMAAGLPYYSYITRELPEYCADLFRISNRREDTFIAGLSMGGYGAMRCALSCPEQYGACASFSGAVDLGAILEFDLPEAQLREIKAILGDTLALSPEHDTYELARRTGLLPPGERPRILQTCGEQDFLLEPNRKFAAFLQEQGYDHTYQEWPGAHDWIFWDCSIEIAFEYFVKNAVS